MPGLILVLVLGLCAIHFLRGLLPPATDLELLFDWGFVPARWSLAWGYAGPEAIIAAASSIDGGDADVAAAHLMIAEYVVAQGGASPVTALTYALLHGSWMHVVLNCVWLVAFGSPVVRRCGTTRSVILAVLATVGAVAVQWLSSPLSTQVVIGASGTVSGFMGAAALFVFRRPERVWDWPVGAQDRRSSLGELVRNRSALFFLGSWLVINLVVGLLSQPLGITEGGVAWQAHIGGLVTGLLVFPWLDPVSGTPGQTSSWTA